MTPYYEEESGTLYNADWRDVLPRAEEGSAALVLADPVYNVGYAYDQYRDEMPDADYLSWQLELARAADRVLAGGGHLFYLNYPVFASRFFWAAPEVSDLAPVELIAWVYNTHTGGKPLRKAFRLWCWLSKGAPGYADEAELCGEYRDPEDLRVAELIAKGRRPRGYDWWHYEQVKNVSAEKVNHPCQLPLAMVRRIVRLACPPGGLVVDPYSGSGTTALAAKLEGRRFLSCEISADYCAEAVKRLEMRQGMLEFTA